MFSDKKAQMVEALMVKHVEKIAEVVKEMHKMLLDYMAADKVFKQESYQVHKLEQEADDIRSEIGLQLYNGAFLAVYRTDYFDIVDRLDRIANHAELFSDFMVLTRPMLPAFMVDPLREIVTKNNEITQALLKFIHSFIDGEQDFLDKKNVLHKFERDVDKIQFHVIRTVFKSDLKKIEKFHLKNVVDKFCRISDLVEDVSDRIEVLAAKIRM
ncbi:DUF47 family protein [bacterium]|nr:DUF47 family protein [bacterium]